MDKNRRKHLGITALAAVTASAASYALTSYLMKLALRREKPPVPKRTDDLIAGRAGIGDDFIQAMTDTAQKLAQAEHERVEITAQDGTPLVGHWFPLERPKRIVIAMHGWRSTWFADCGMIFDFLRDEGCAVLLPEQRGQGDSGGDYMGFGLTERYDVRDWVEWVTQRCGNTVPIYLSGVSMGATTVLMAAGLDLPTNVCGVIADCGFTSPDAIWRHVYENNLHLHYGLRGVISREIAKRRYQFEPEKYSTMDALKDSSLPVLFVHGTDDHFVPVTMTFENYKACTAPKKILVVPGADHGMSYFMARADYEKMVKEFWQECDQSGSTSA